jgi:SAM-dependent methyltransferase
VLSGENKEAFPGNSSVIAQMHPTCHVYGTDLSAIQPRNSATNCTFLVEDAEEDDWIHGHSNLYDYIHLRAVFSCFDDPRKVMRNCYKNMRPGGWIEYNDGVPLPGSMDGNLEGKYGLLMFLKPFDTCSD